MSYDPFQSTGSTSGTQNVSVGQSTASQYQGDSMSDNLIFPESGQVLTIFSPLVFGSGASLGSTTSQLAFGGTSGSILFNIGGSSSSSGNGPAGSSGGGNSNVTVVLSGFTPQGTIQANTSGAFAPVGCFLVFIPQISGGVTVKVPFFNS